ncbi:TonB-dependent receptor [Sphingosinicella soli]|uniref:Iron complex outermembrane receptor protein n=1 Tax=Sphingosinicella soli TaxID=333708 RepID=A0A7W7B4M6_9SPHN|nr:TonB-dependent receptor [Sphingosinicella soli]MBB4633030.1 iron complex outermembrane receptor protein [Sphingosinicella soli]
MSRFKNTCGFALMVSTAASALCGTAIAQENPGASSGGFEDIIVTARKREENLQQVPDTVTAFSASVIEERRLERIDDFLAVTPNVNITNDQDTATNNISIRGLGSNRNQAAAVAFSVDGVILPDADAFTMDLTDVERLEVLKGPQGALYGKGAIAGAINITTKRPTNTFEGEAKLSYGTGDAWRVFGAVSGPIVPDLVLARVTVSHRDGNGTIKNDFDGRTLDRNRQTRVSGRIIIEPTDDFSIDLRAAHMDEKGGALWFSLVDVLGTTGGEITEEMAAVRPNLDGPSSTDRTVTDLSMSLNYDTSIGTFTSITAWDKIDVDFSEDLDISPFPLVPFTRQLRVTESWSQELRLTSPGAQRLRYILGAYYQHSKRDVTTLASLDACLFAGTCITPDGFESSGLIIDATLADTRLTFNQYAVFGQLNYDLLDTLELTAALRYDTNEAKQDDYLASATDKATFSKLQPKVSLAYKPSDELTLYATYSQGFKSGSFNPIAAGAAFPRVIGKETSRNYEIGTKTSWLDRRVILNVAAFYTQHLNPQIFQLDAATFTQGSLNARKAAIKGFEFELAARPVKGLDLNAAFGYIDTKIKDFDGTTDAYVGQQLPNAPKYTLNLGAQYTLDLSDDMAARARVDFNAKGRQSFQDFQLPATPDAYLFQKAYSTVDAQIGVEGERWGLTVFGRNLFKTHYATSAFSRYIFAAGLVPLGSDAIQPDPGRTFGVEARVKF